MGKHLQIELETLHVSERVRVDRPPGTSALNFGPQDRSQRREWATIHIHGRSLTHYWSHTWLFTVFSNSYSWTGVSQRIHTTDGSAPLICLYDYYTTKDSLPSTWLFNLIGIDHWLLPILFQSRRRFTDVYFSLYCSRLVLLLQDIPLATL